MIKLLGLLLAALTIGVHNSGVDVDKWNMDPNEQQLAKDLNDFDGRLGISNILTNNSGIAKTGFYIDGNLEYDNSKLGYLQDTLVLDDTLYLSFTSAGLVKMDLNNPDLKAIEDKYSKEVYYDVEKIVTDGEFVYYIKDDQVCKQSNSSKETCVSDIPDVSPIEQIELYKGNLYIAVFDEMETELLTINPKTLELSSKSKLGFSVMQTTVVNDVLYVDTGEEFGVYQDGKIVTGNLNGHVYLDNPDADGISKMEAVGSKLIVYTNRGVVYSIDSADNNKVTELVKEGQLLSIDGVNAYIYDYGKTEGKNIIKYNSETNESTYVNAVGNVVGGTHLFY